MSVKEMEVTGPQEATVGNYKPHSCFIKTE
jgi:hypothetical protein